MTHHTKTSLLELLAKIRYDTTAIQANVTELNRAIAALPDDQPDKQHHCPHDGLAFPTARRLNEHLRNVHDIGDAADPYPLVEPRATPPEGASE